MQRREPRLHAGDGCKFPDEGWVQQRLETYRCEPELDDTGRRLIDDAIRHGEVDGIGHIVELVRDCGALDRSHEAALSRAAAAEEAIGELPASKWKDAMESLASYAVSRRY